jgi:hypothetical protein
MTVHNEPMSTYLARTEHSRSDIKAAYGGERSWLAHNDASNVFKGSAASELGNLVHTYVLDPETFNAQYMFEPPLDRTMKKPRAGKAYRDAVAEMKSRRPGVAIVTADMEKIARGCEAALHAHPEAARLLWKNRIAVERTIVFEKDGLPFRIRPDCEASDGPGRVVCIDLKTVGKPERRFFNSSRSSLGYDFSPALYSAGVGEAHRGKACDFYWITVCTTPDAGGTHEVSVYKAGPSMMAMSEKKVRQGISNMKHYIANPPDPSTPANPGIIVCEPEDWEIENASGVKPDTFSDTKIEL